MSAAEAPKVDWYESAFSRVVAGVGDEWDKISAKNNITQEERSGIFSWFKKTWPQKQQNLKDCENRIEELWLSGKTDGKSQAEFNEQLRIYRNGHVWLMEKFIVAKKEKEAEEAKNAGKPRQGRLI